MLRKIVLKYSFQLNKKKNLLYSFNLKKSTLFETQVLKSNLELKLYNKEALQTKTSVNKNKKVIKKKIASQSSQR